jgi:hypothetical protein
MYTSRPKMMRDGGCNNRRPCMLDNEERMRMSFWPSTVDG